MTDRLLDDDLSFMDFHLKQKKQYLYVRVVKAKDLVVKDVTDSCDPYVEVRLGNYKETTRGFEKKSDPEWNRVFAFPRDKIDGFDATMLEVSVEDKGAVKDKDTFLGWVLFDLCVVPKRQPSDSPLNPKWYKLEDREGEKVMGELMLAVWWGIQADEAFPETDSVGLASADSVGLASDASVGLINIQYLYVRVVKARDLLAKDVTGSCDPYAEVRMGNYKGTTRHFEKKSNPEWNQVFAFSRDKIQSTILEVNVKDKDHMKDDFMGWVLFDLIEVPKRVPPNSPLALQWYRLEDRKGMKLKGEIMLAVWWGTQADEAFPEAWHLDAATVGGSDALADIRSKVYLSPRLWYVRVNVIEAQDLIPSDRTRFPEVFVKAQLGHQAFRTRVLSMRNSTNPMWNEDLMFVAAEPFEEHLILSVEDHIGPGNNEVLGICIVPLQYVERRFDQRHINAKWFKLQRDVIVEGRKTKQTMFGGMIHMGICLEGGYHVLDESAHFCSDFRPTDKQLWKKGIGILELGILSANGLSPMKTKDGRETTDAYCVAKYGPKWVRTRTIIDSFTPEWNEQYTWEVFDPCTVITIGVFNNCHLQGGDKGNGARDSRIGKVRIRLSTLETDRVYTHFYPLLVLHPSGVKKMGEIHLAVRFTCSSLLNTMRMYSQPLLPKMHYLHPLTVIQLDSLSVQATQIVSMRLSQAEPPLRKEIVDYMLDGGSHMWSMRKSKANFFRLTGAFHDLIAVGRWSTRMYNWKNPITVVIVHIIFFALLMHPERILSLIFLYLAFIGVWNYRWRPKYPPHMNTRLSCADADGAHPDELDEEFDAFPTALPGGDIVRMRYDRLRSILGRIQTMAGDLATQGERLQSLLSWRDPRATALFVIFCLIAAIVLYAIPFYAVAIQTILYVSKPSSSRNKLASVGTNFFRRLPSRIDQML